MTTNAEEATFERHYVEWRKRRICAIVRHYGESRLGAMSILEVGAGECDIGAYFYNLGARVTCWEARSENIGAAKTKYPSLRIEQVDFDCGSLASAKFDLIIHMGLLYHQKNFEPSLRWCCRSSNHLVLETEVCDSMDPSLILKVKENEKARDQSFHGSGVRPSAGYIENILNSEGINYYRINDSRCNSGIHTYNWDELNTGGWRHGLRRFWFCSSNRLPLRSRVGVFVGKARKFVRRTVCRYV